MRGTIAQLAEEARKSDALIEEFLGYFRNKRGIPDDSVAIASPPKCQRVTGNGDDASRLVQSSTSEGNSKPISSLSNLLTTESELFLRQGRLEAAKIYSRVLSCETCLQADIFREERHLPELC
jgi:hypothetical protein